MATQYTHRSLCGVCDVCSVKIAVPRSTSFPLIYLSSISINVCGAYSEYSNYKRAHEVLPRLLVSNFILPTRCAHRTRAANNNLYLHTIYWFYLTKSRGFVIYSLFHFSSLFWCDFFAAILLFSEYYSLLCYTHRVFYVHYISSFIYLLCRLRLPYGMRLRFAQWRFNMPIAIFTHLNNIPQYSWSKKKTKEKK